jgi:hypothetical protein
MNEMTDILAESITPRGTRDLEFQEMLDVLEAGQAIGLVLFSVDVTTARQERPLPEWMFRLTDEETETVAITQIVPMALDFYRQHASDPDLTKAWFQIYFEMPD